MWWQVSWQLPMLFMVSSLSNWDHITDVLPSLIARSLGEIAGCLPFPSLGRQSYACKICYSDMVLRANTSVNFISMGFLQPGICTLALEICRPTCTCDRAGTEDLKGSIRHFGRGIYNSPTRSTLILVQELRCTSQPQSGWWWWWWCFRTFPGPRSPILSQFLFFWSTKWKEDWNSERNCTTNSSTENSYCNRSKLLYPSLPSMINKHISVSVLGN